MSWDESPDLLAPVQSFSGIRVVINQSVEPTHQKKASIMVKGLSFLAWEMGTMLFPILQSCSNGFC